MSEKGSEKKLFTISELARRSGTTPATIKHYVNEGLLSPVKKTGKTMAWYNEESVKRVLLVRSLKQERFLPLSVIKRLIGEGSLTSAAMELDHSIYPNPETNLEERQFSLSELADETGLNEERINRLTDSGILHPIRDGAGGIRFFSELDAKIAQIIRQREEDGLSFEYSSKLLSQYSEAIERAVARDIHFFISMVLADPDTEDPLSLLNRDDDSVNLFLFYARRKFNRLYVDEALRQVEDFSSRFNRWVPLHLREVEEQLPKLPLEKEEIHALQDLAKLLSGKTSEAATGTLAADENSPVGILTGVVLSMLDFSKEGALDRRLQALLMRFDRIARYGFIPPEITHMSRYLGKTEDDRRKRRKEYFSMLLPPWITAGIYLALPPILGYEKKGTEIMHAVLGAGQHLLDLWKNKDPEGFHDSVEYAEKTLLPAIRRELNLLEQSKKGGYTHEG
ncbi:MAG: MerR family transcriptional regulator [Spirochaetia bacterium]